MQIISRFLKKMKLNKSLEDVIIVEIAKRYPFSIEDIRSVYNLTKSFDATVKTCEAACELGYSDPVQVLEMRKLKEVNDHAEIVIGKITKLIGDLEGQNDTRS